MPPPIVLSRFQVEELFRAREQGAARAQVSPDLGRSTVEVAVEAEGVRFPGGEFLTWEALEEIRHAPNNCFVVTDNTLEKVQRFSAHTNRLYTLMPTPRAPTLLVSGVPMHRVKGIDPYADTQRKIKTIAPIVGRVLDTATGLGYTAIAAARTAEEVITIELDPEVLEIARLNPWSQELFENPKIVQIIGDSFEEIQRFEDSSFARIIHDPPAFRLAGELYSGEFYRQLHRVLQRGGRLFHYIGDLRSRSGRGVARGAVRRLYEAGFRRVVRRPEAFGLVAYK